MINELELLSVLGIFFIFEIKFFWNKEINACFNVECVLLGQKFEFLGGYCSLASGYGWLLLVTWWLLVVTARYRWLPLVITRSHFYYKRFYHIFTSGEDIFVAVMENRSSVLGKAIAYFQNLTNDYSANDDIV